MAKQKSIIKLEGTIGDITFYKSKDGYLARQNNPISGDRIANDPKFQRTRENGAEFGRGGNAGKVLRKALREVIQQTSDGRMVSRLTKEMVKVLQADQVSVRGQRNVLDGELELLRGFNFNSNAALDTVLFMSYTAQIDRATGVFSISLPVFDPKTSLKVPAGSTHFELVICAADIDFEQELIESGVSRSGYLSSTDPSLVPLSLDVTLSVNSTRPLFLVLGVLFYQKVNALYYPLSNGSYNALSLVEISGF